MRSPSGVHQSGMRGREPVATRALSKSTRSVPSTPVDLDLVRADEAGRAADHAHALARQQPVMPSWRWLLIPSMRVVSASVSTSAIACSRPIPVDRRRKLIAPPVAIIVFDGMQSQQVGGAADDVALDHRDLGAEPGGVRGRRVAGRSTADDHEARRHGAQAMAQLDWRPTADPTGAPRSTL